MLSAINHIVDLELRLVRELTRDLNPVQVRRGAQNTPTKDEQSLYRNFGDSGRA